jgi:hypothetical protein
MRRKPTFYIASGLANAPQVIELRDLLVARGWEPAYDWTKHGNVRTGDDTPETKARILAVANEESDHAGCCDVFVCLLPGGKGTHFELGRRHGELMNGYASSDMLSFIWAPEELRAGIFGTGDKTSVFYHLSEFGRLESVTMLGVAAELAEAWAAEVGEEEEEDDECFECGNPEDDCECAPTVAEMAELRSRIEALEAKLSVKDEPPEGEEPKA